MTVIQPYTLPDQDEAIRSFRGIFGVYLRRNFLVEFTPLILYYIITFTLTGAPHAPFMPCAVEHAIKKVWNGSLALRRGQQVCGVANRFNA